MDFIPRTMRKFPPQANKFSKRAGNEFKSNWTRRKRKGSVQPSKNYENPDVSGYWTGEIFGTNKGGFTLDLKQEGEKLIGLAKIFDRPWVNMNTTSMELLRTQAYRFVYYLDADHQQLSFSE